MGNIFRLTIKDLGDYTNMLQSAQPGIRVIVEGPYGAFTPALRTAPKVLLVAGGIGITPLRAMYESLDGGPGDVVLLYRVRHERDLVFKAELEQVSRRRGFGLLYSIGRREDGPDPFHPDMLRKLVPDLADRDVFVCGPAAMTTAVCSAVRAAGTPSNRIHRERFSY